MIFEYWFMPEKRFSKPRNPYRWVLVFSLLLFLSVLSDAPGQENSRVEITIQNSAFEFQGGALRPNLPGVIVLRNQDKVKHGFTSPFLQELEVRVESTGVTTYGKGIKGVYIGPGETLQIHLFPTREGKFTFRCDIHPNMKGELILLSVGAA
jgi:hypothetical protein